MSINSTVLSGNLTEDPVEFATPKGVPVVEFRIAGAEIYQPSVDEEPTKRPVYVTCVMFGERAWKKMKYLKKGTKVSASGQLAYRSWKTKDGTMHSRLQMMLTELDILSIYTKPVENSHDGHGQRTNEQSSVATPTVFTDDDIPF